MTESLAGAGAGGDTTATRQSLFHPLPPEKRRAEAVKQARCPLAAPLGSPRQKGELAPGRNLRPSPAEGTRVWVPVEEGKVRAGVSECKQFHVFNKYYLCNHGGLGASPREVEGGFIAQGNIFPFGLDRNVRPEACCNVILS